MFEVINQDADKAEAKRARGTRGKNNAMTTMDTDIADQIDCIMHGLMHKQGGLMHKQGGLMHKQDFCSNIDFWFRTLISVFEIWT